MDMPEESQRNRSQTPDYVDREYNIADQQSFLEIFTQENEKAVKQKLNDEWLIQSTQTKLKEFENFQEEQKSTIQELQIKNKQLEQMITNETSMRQKVLEKMEKIQNMMNIYVGSYNQIKNNFQSCLITKNKLSDSYDKILKDVQDAHREMASEKKKFTDHITSMNIILQNWKDQYINTVNENKELVQKHEKEITHMKDELRKLQVDKKDLEKTNIDLLSELREIISQKNGIMDDLMKLQEKYDANVKVLEEHRLKSDEEIQNLTQFIDELKHSYDKLKSESDNLQLAFDKQNNFIDEIQEKKNSLENTISDLEELSSNLENKIAVLEQQIQADKTSHAHQILTSKNHLKNMEDKNKEIVTNNYELKQNLDIAQEKIIQLDSDLQELQSEKISLEAHIEDYRQRNEQLQLEYKDSEQKLIVELNEMKDENEKYRHMEAHLQAQLLALSNELTELRDNLTKQQNDIMNKEVEQQQQAKNLANEKEMLQIRIRSLQSEVSITKEKGEEKVKELEDQGQVKIKQMMEQAQYYKSEVDKIRESERIKHEKEIEALKDRLRLMEFQVSELTASKLYLQNELEKKLLGTIKGSSEKDTSIQPSQTMLTQKPKASLPKIGLKKFGNWDDSESDSSCDRNLADLDKLSKSSYSKSKLRLLPSKRVSTPSSLSELDLSPKLLKTDINQKNLDKLFDSIREPSFREPLAKKTNKNRKHIRKTII